MQSRENKKSGIQQCQRCLKYGHWTYECKNEVTYVYRPSRTMQYKEPSLRQELNTDKGPKTKIQDRDISRRVKKDIDSDEESDSSSSSSSSSSISNSKSRSISKEKKK